jgi:hypothetical protein
MQSTSWSHMLTKLILGSFGSAAAFSLSLLPLSIFLDLDLNLSIWRATSEHALTAYAVCPV